MRSSPLSNSLRACSPFESINQISRGPNLPLFPAKAINLPSGEKDQAIPPFRNLRGTPPATETAQMLASSSVCSDMSFSVVTTLARNQVLSGNQAPQAQPDF